MREHFRFLKQHRKELRLKVNAAEDLLLNGVQEPTHRGVCQHLLGKVDRRAVLAACERLPDDAAAKLLSGIIAFAADIEYVLLLLEKIQRSAPPAEATAALSRGLQRIDFSAVSSAQMRRVLNLIVELFPERERPELLMGLLESPSFRGAFDDSLAQLPEALSRLVLPLRAAQATLFHGEPNVLGAEALREGVRLLLSARDKSLVRHPSDVRDRLFDFGLQACSAPDHSWHARLRLLLESFPRSERSYSRLAMSFVRHLLECDEESEATKILKVLATEHPKFRLPGRWLQLLAAPRIDRFALPDLEDSSDARTSTSSEAAEEGPTTASELVGWKSGYALASMRPVRVWLASAEETEALTASATWLTELSVPGLVPLLAAGRSAQGAPYLVLENPGEWLDTLLARRHGLRSSAALRACSDALVLLAGIAAQGGLLPDAAPKRFARDEDGRLWLVDVRGASRAEPDVAGAQHLVLARQFCGEVLGSARSYLPPPGLTAELAAADSFAELWRAVSPFPQLGHSTGTSTRD